MVSIHLPHDKSPVDTCSLSALHLQETDVQVCDGIPVVFSWNHSNHSYCIESTSKLYQSVCSGHSLHYHCDSIGTHNHHIFTIHSAWHEYLSLLSYPKQAL